MQYPSDFPEEFEMISDDYGSDCSLRDGVGSQAWLKTRGLVWPDLARVGSREGFAPDLAFQCRQILQTVRGSADLLLKDTELSARQMEYVEWIIESCRDLLELLEPPSSAGGSLVPASPSEASILDQLPLGCL